MSQHAKKPAAGKKADQKKPGAPAGHDEHAALKKKVAGSNYADGKKQVKPKDKHAPGDHDDGEVVYGGPHDKHLEDGAMAPLVGANYLQQGKPGAIKKREPGRGSGEHTQNTGSAQGNKPLGGKLMTKGPAGKKKHK